MLTCCACEINAAASKFDGFLVVLRLIAQNEVRLKGLILIDSNIEPGNPPGGASPPLYGEGTYRAQV